MSYYSTIILMVLLALGVLSVLIFQNSRMPRRKKRLFFFANILIACSTLAECAGLHIGGNPNIPAWVLNMVKAIDYSLTPMAGGAIIAIVQKPDVKRAIFRWLFIANAVFQIVCATQGWMVIIDEQNHYTHGKLYPVYMAFYIVVLIILAIELVIYGKNFKKQNRISLYATMFLVFAGIGMQEILGSEHRVAYLALTFGAAYLFIHSSEFAQMKMDDRISEQQIKISVDALTGVYSRFAFIEDMDVFDKNMPDNLAVFLFDLNGLKSVNDSFRHEAGDKMLCGAAECISTTVGKYGKTYRIGGDEFVVFAEMTKEQADEELNELGIKTREWSDTEAIQLSISAGYVMAKDYFGYSVEELTKEADKAMYEQKKEYYQQNGVVRRKTSYTG